MKYQYYKCECSLCKRKILGGVSHNYEVMATCASCINGAKIDEGFKKEDPVNSGPQKKAPLHAKVVELIFQKLGVSILGVIHVKKVKKERNEKVPMLLL